MESLVESRYPYRPLNPSLSEIRLVLLAPGSGSDEIQCSFQHVLLDDNPRYDALSYAWGAVSDVRPIVLDGRVFQVTVNLHAALRQIRHQTEELALWIDAVSVNQNDARERGRQVRIMRDIYRSANCVLAWLGEASQADYTGLGLLDTMLREQKLYQESPAGVGPLHSDSLWDCLFGIFNRPYWKRMWVVQELALAMDCRVLCGNDRRPLSEYMIVVGILVSDAYRLPYQNPVLNKAENLAFKGMSELLLYWRRGENLSLLELLLITHEFDATDSRDRLYALLGLSSPTVRDSIIPDYCESKTLSQVGADLVEHFITKEKSLDIILGNREMPPSPDPTVPSWIPLLGVPSHWTTKARIQWLSSAGKKFAPKAQVSPDRKKLIAKGYQIDTVVYKLGPYADGLAQLSINAIRAVLSEIDETTSKMLWVIRELYRLEMGTTEGFSTINNREALWRTLICDVSRGVKSGEVITTPATPEYGHMYNGLIGYRGKFKCEVAPTLGPGETPDPRLKYAQEAETEMRRRCFFVTRRGYFGMGAHGIETTDMICILYGASLPVVLRKKECSEEYMLVGDAYVHGIMNDQEATSTVMPGGKGTSKEREFVLC
ncbi:hypothetical protein FGG08_000159 [Glutinoglossum americanum]|uniref:Heterokaryon incompatibility domain-containing protein n=1 Tax=Glutinoglossum americanum TaxID=1670608 RepID=A0A9P8I4E5_9PEZI|nr:hypothetical protein FGG08_000159 [Glutinoglossum americanum]